ncbi:hypothetical protein ABZ527_33570 [Streptomyces griseofuscus]|uniref:hypothetical protein n=1 Tax=Streptomyces griseofuscus TaxID=146922 RepID=UPI0033D3C8B9
MIAAGRTLGRYLHEGALVVLESTSLPGTTRTVLGSVLEEVFGLRMGSQFALGSVRVRNEAAVFFAPFPPPAFFAACARLIASRCALPGRFFGCCPHAALAAFCAGVCPARRS